MEGWDGGRGGGGGLLYMIDVAGRPLVDQTVTATSKLWYRAAKHLLNLGFVDMKLGSIPLIYVTLQRGSCNITNISPPAGRTYNKHLTKDSLFMVGEKTYR